MNQRRAGTTSRAARFEEYSYRVAVPLALLIGLVVLVYVAVTWHARLIFAEHPQDYRENATYLSTALLLRGQNPWALKNLPQYANVYGVLYNLVALPVVSVFGCTLVVHRLLSASLFLLCSVVIFAVLRRYRTPVLLALLAPIFLYQQYMPTYASDAKPDNLGLLLFLCALFIPWWRRFSTPSLCVATVLSLLAVCAKVYFGVSILYLAVYVFLFEGKGKAVLYLVLSLSALGVLVELVDWLNAAYWPMVFFVQLNGTWPRWPFLVEQLSWYWRGNRGLLAVVGLLLLTGLYVRVRGWLSGSTPDASAAGGRVFAPWLDLRAPLLCG
jgi:hypothetical protein